MTILLSRGDRGVEVASLQQGINKVGAMLKVDSDFGAATERGVRYAQSIAGFSTTGSADQQLIDWADSKSDPFASLITEGVAFIAREETGGLYYYERVAKFPHYPGGDSGITLGVGFDLRFQSLEKLQDQWGPFFSSSTLGELEKDVGRRGTKKRVRELKSLKIEVPFYNAWRVFIKSTLPEYYDKTERVYPILPELPGLCASALVSLVYNRGAKLSGQNRLEMKNIFTILGEAKTLPLDSDERNTILKKVENEFVSMRRLWALDSGLVKRRQEEANMWRRGLSEL